MPDWAGRGSERAVNVASPGAYVVSDRKGDVDSSSGGLFYRDTRHLSRFVLTVNGGRLVSQGVDPQGSRAEFSLLANNSGEGLRVVRRRTLGAGMHDEFLFTNDSGAAVEAVVSVECAADFEDIFAVRGFARAVQRNEAFEEVLEDALRYTYRREGFSRGTEVRLSAEGVEPEMERGRISLRLRIGAREKRLVRISVKIEEGGEMVQDAAHAPLYTGAPELETSWDVLRKSWERSIEDLESLSFDAGDGLLVPAAGTPWFMALFGRDSLITAYETMILTPEPARNALRALAKYQATGRDDFTDAEPGKIPHELRRGEMAFFEEIPEKPYYGTADATPLFLILLEELWRWTNDAEFAREMEEPARSAVAWILNRLNYDERGYIPYKTRSSAGLQNQGWKDSDDGVLFQNGKQAEPPISVCEVQGYAYDALLRTAELAEKVWGDELFGAGLRREARALRARFEVDFWMEDRGYYAVALDGRGRRVDSITSNPGHLLWSGILSRDRAGAVVDRLMGVELFGGWGIRTMTSGEGGYDPNSYHNGSVWPHDNALISQGLQRYGYRDAAARVARAILEAAVHFDYRLPEVFAGYSREESSKPIEHPISCSPQAWAAGATPLLVRAALGLEPGHSGPGSAPPQSIFVPESVFPGSKG